MKKVITLALIVLLPGLIWSQHCPYLKKYLLQGEQALHAGHFDAAIRAFTIAITHCPDSAQLGSEGINRTCKALEALKNEAELAQKKALQAKKQAEIEKQRAEIVMEEAILQSQLASRERDQQINISNATLKIRKQLQDSLILIDQLIDKLEEAQKKAIQEKAEAIDERDKAVSDRAKALRQISKMYFYKDSFGIAYDDQRQKYGFVDRNMHTRIEFNYDILQSFEEENGFAKGKHNKEDLIFQLISTQGREYPLAMEIYQIKPSTRAIDFRYKALYSIPYAVYRYDSLQILLLDGNNISNLSDFRLSRGVGAISKNLRDWLHNSGQIRGKLKNLSSIEILSLANNQFKAVEPEVQKMTGLRILNLSNNAIRSVAAEIGKLEKLQELDLSSNLLDSLPSEISKLRNLRRIDLSGNHFSGSELDKIQAWLPQCRVVTEFQHSQQEQ